MNSVEMRVLTCRLIEKINNNPNIGVKAGISYKVTMKSSKKSKKKKTIE